MCGIAGYFLKPSIAGRPDWLDKMAAKIAHRGPDGTGQHICGSAGFIQTRLAIIDLEGGKQPFIEQGPKGEAMLIANGEIYNHRELRESHLSEVSFTSQSDCAVLLPLWLRHKSDSAQYLRGMYAISFYDENSDEGGLMRDPFGIKPLYYFEGSDGVFFASEIPALRAIQKIKHGPDRLAAAQILDKQFIADGKTPFEDIKALAPGSYLAIKQGRVTGACHHAGLSDAGKAMPSNPDQLDDVLADSVMAHQMSDVPFGMFLSGGVDSASLLSMMMRLRSANRTDGPSAPLLAYSARFDSQHKADETILARQLALRLGAEFIDVCFDQKMFFDLAGTVIGAMDMPVADYAILPSFALARRAAQDVKVILVGEGGDEFFAGYGRYRAGLRVLAPKFPNRPGPALKAGILQQDLAAHLYQKMQDSRHFMPAFHTRLLNKDSALKQLQAYDIEGWLADNLLVKLDRCLMANSLEGRTPFIDKKLSDFAYHLSVHNKIRGRHGKYLLKSWLNEHLPEANAFARKRGFTVPVGQWIASKADRLAELVACQQGIKELVTTDLIKGIFQQAGDKTAILAWRLLFYAIWHQIHVLNQPAGQPVLDLLDPQS